MNSKKCKRLRTLARNMTTGQPNAEYRITTPAKPQQNGHDLNGNPTYWTPQSTQALTATCTKGVYRRLKKDLTRAERGLA